MVHSVCGIVYSGLSTHILTRRMTCDDAYVQYAEIPFNSHPHKEDDSNSKQNICYSESHNL